MTNTPEHAAASLEVAIVDAMQPLGDGAAELEELAGALRRATAQGDTATVRAIGQDMLLKHARFGQVFRTWLVGRPDAPPWRSLVADAQAPSRLPTGSDAVDRSST